VSFRKSHTFRGFTGLFGVALLLMASKLDAAPFPFSSYEKNYAADTDVTGAKRDLLKILPLGTSVVKYERMFRDTGGQCMIIDRSETDEKLKCEYDHGSPVSAGWTCIITFDPSTKRSAQVDLSYALTGP